MDKQTTLYRWTGSTLTGEHAHGIMEATSIALVKMELGKQGIRSKQIRKKHALFLNKKITERHLTVFSRQLATLVKMGLSLMQSLDIIIKCQTNLLMKTLTTHIKKDMEAGLTLSEALRNHPTYFNELIPHLIAAGEKLGKLDKILETIALYKEKNTLIKKNIRKALAYPLIVCVSACLITLALLIFVVPQFVLLFNNFNADLPLFTQMVVTLASILKTYWLIILLLLSLLGYGFRFARKNLACFAPSLDSILLKLPLLGSILGKTIIARFSRTLSLCLTAELPIMDALTAVASICDNHVYAAATKQIREDIATGLQIQTAMQNTKLFPDMVIQMTATGEASGSLGVMLKKIAYFYEEEVNHAIDTLTHLLEPFIMIVVGILVGGLVIAMYLPIFKLGSIV